MDGKIMGREPAAVVAALGSILVVVAALNVPWLNAGQAAAITAAVASLILVFTTRPVAPALVTGIVSTGAALFAEYGLEAPEATVAAISAAVLAVFALISREQVSPVETPVTHS
jgi:hypothetical protein